MKLRIEERDGEDEVVIFCKQKSERIKHLTLAVERVLAEDGKVVLTLGENEYYVSKKEILFFETAEGKITAHTRDGMYYSAGTLQSIERTLPYSFVRASKSCIVNAAEICALSKNFTGMGEVLFKRSSKRVFVSRSCYKELKERVYDIHDLNNKQ